MYVYGNANKLCCIKECIQCMSKAPGGVGGTRVYFGWVCAARVSKFGPRFRKNLHSK